MKPRVASYRVYYREHGNDQFTDFEDNSMSNWKPQNLLPDTQYDFAVSVLRSVDGNDIEGKLGNIVNGTTHCTGTLYFTNSNHEISPHIMRHHFNAEFYCIIVNMTC